MSLWHGTLSLDTLTGCASPCKAAKSAEGSGSGVYVRWISGGKRGGAQNGVFKRRPQMPRWLAACQVGKVDYVIDTRLFRQRHSSSVLRLGLTLSHLFQIPDLTQSQILPFLPQLSASQPAVCSRQIFPGEWAFEAGEMSE